MAAVGIAIDPLYSLQITPALVADTFSKFRFMDGTSFSDFISNKDKHWMPIGGGAHCILYMFGKAGVNYLIKNIKSVEEGIPYDIEAALAEINALIKLRDSPYAVKLLAAQVYEEQAYLLYPWIEGVILLKWLETAHTIDEKKQVKEATTKSEMDIQLKRTNTKGLEYLF